MTTGNTDKDLKTHTKARWENPTFKKKKERKENCYKKSIKGKLLVSAITVDDDFSLKQHNAFWLQSSSIFSSFVKRFTMGPLHKVRRSK